MSIKFNGPFIVFKLIEAIKLFIKSVYTGKFVEVVADRIQLTDSANLSASKHLLEGVSFLDSKSFSVAKSCADQTIVSDALRLTAIKGVVDETRFVDGGFLVYTDGPKQYVEQGYVADGYVGIATNF